MKIIDDKLIEETAKKSRESSRKRDVFRLHESDSAKVQRLINVVQPESEVKPHKHEDTDELFISLKGEIKVNEYDNQGIINKTCIISQNSHEIAVEIEAGTWHSLESLKPDSAVMIIMEGPYHEDSHKVFPEW